MYLSPDLACLSGRWHGIVLYHRTGTESLAPHSRTLSSVLTRLARLANECDVDTCSGIKCLRPQLQRCIGYMHLILSWERKRSWVTVAKHALWERTKVPRIQATSVYCRSLEARQRPNRHAETMCVVRRTATYPRSNGVDARSCQHFCEVAQKHRVSTPYILLLLLQFEDHAK